MVSYAKWDNFGDSSDDDDAAAAPAPARAPAGGGAMPIPPVITMTSKDGYPHADAWRRLNGDACFVATYDDAAALAFVQEHYPWIAGDYAGLGHGVERADLFRYLAVHRTAGAYGDSDAAPLAPLEGWFARFGYSPHLAAQHVLVVGVEFPWACDGNELQLCQWAFAA